MKCGAANGQVLFMQSCILEALTPAGSSKYGGVLNNGGRSATYLGRQEQVLPQSAVAAKACRGSEAIAHAASLAAGYAA